MAPEERWLAAVWPAAGYEAIGIDPEAPPGSSYRQAEFEHSDLPSRVDAIVACTSLHHVADLAGVLDLVHAALLPGGTVVVVEWARERFGEATARWCFGRLPEPGPDPGWLHRLHAEWQESGRSWDTSLLSWAQAEGLHTGLDILNGLDARFDCRARLSARRAALAEEFFDRAGRGGLEVDMPGANG